MEGNFVAYYRTSTKRQDLGIKAQKSAVATYLNGGGWKLIGEFEEKESGKRHEKREELAKALALCKKRKATLVIAKLDRLARNVHFVSGLQEAKIKFVCCDNPNANELTINILAAVAQQEAKDISARTSAALQALKTKGTPWVSKKSGRLVERLGCPNPSKGSAEGVEAIKNKADEFAAKMLPVVDAIRARGLTTLQQIADELTRQRWKTSRGADEWTPAAVRNLLLRRPTEEAAQSSGTGGALRFDR
jgi:DNA invertase Pin-like site-specific DNA recombinase